MTQARGMTKVRCVHCGKRAASRARGLCWACHYDETIRSQYPTLKALYTHRGSRAYEGGARQEEVRGMEPTPYLPGTPEWEAVAMERAEKGLPIQIPGDARRGED